MSRYPVKNTVTAMFFGACVLAPLAVGLAQHAEYQMINKLQAQEKNTSRSTIEIPKVEYKSFDTKDPFLACVKREVAKRTDSSQPIAPAAVVAPNLAIQGIVWGGKIAQAIVNNKLVTVGDTVEEARIVAITGDGLEIIYKEKPFHIPSPSSLHKVDSTNKAQGGHDAR